MSKKALLKALTPAELQATFKGVRIGEVDYTSEQDWRPVTISVVVHAGVAIGICQACAQIKTKRPVGFHLATQEGESRILQEAWVPVTGQEEAILCLGSWVAPGLLGSQGRTCKLYIEADVSRALRAQFATSMYPTESGGAVIIIQNAAAILGRHTTFLHRRGEEATRILLSHAPQFWAATLQSTALYRPVVVIPPASIEVVQKTEAVKLPPAIGAAQRVIPTGFEKRIGLPK